MTGLCLRAVSAVRNRIWNRNGRRVSTLGVSTGPRQLHTLSEALELLQRKAELAEEKRGSPISRPPWVPSFVASGLSTPESVGNFSTLRRRAPHPRVPSP